MLCTKYTREIQRDNNRKCEHSRVCEFHAKLRTIKPRRAQGWKKTYVFKNRFYVFKYFKSFFGFLYEDRKRKYDAKARENIPYTVRRILLKTNL